jgi:hypothetical protein
MNIIGNSHEKAIGSLLVFSRIVFALTLIYIFISGINISADEFYVLTNF